MIPSFLRSLLLAAAIALPLLAQAQAFPSRPMRIVCPFPPGGGVDITARALAAELAKQIGQPVTVENKPGAGGNIAAAEVAKAAPDGYTLFLTLNALHAISPLLYAKLPFDAVKDFAWITTLVQFNNVLVVPAASPVKTVQEPSGSGEKPARQADLRLQRQRHQPASHRRTVQVDGERRHHSTCPTRAARRR